ncbi:hypothetical protein EYZ11_013538 [Aspergillus tanneri]|uniref:Uncharacterized protein n=1 Tax=Aspergillus tanneri TaxID=1220188 RepID=A0A4S3IXN3_9EURO|nr:hypothetical protein EYZ11_013538 [Aspergillus tanneri]
MNSTLERIEAAQAPRKRKKTKREVQRLGDSGILRVKDANRSIADRKAKDDEKNRKAANKAYLKADNNANCFIFFLYGENSFTLPTTHRRKSEPPLIQIKRGQYTQL